VCTGSRVIAKTQDLLLEGGVRAHLSGGGTEDGRRSPLHGGCVETGGKRKGTNEPVSFLNDALKPKLYVYDRYNDMYLLYLRRVKPINRISTVTNCELVYVRFNWFLQNDIFTCVN